MDDLISRQAAIEYFQRIIDATNTDSRYNLDLAFIDGLEFCINHLSTIPFAQPEQKKGKWIDLGRVYECSVCHERSCCAGNYCTDCGAEMEGEE